MRPALGTHLRWAVGALGVGLAAVACGGPAGDSAPEQAAPGDGAGAQAFCDDLLELDTGPSPPAGGDNAEELTELAAVAPEEVRDDVLVIRDYHRDVYVEGDPSTDSMEGMPEDVQAAGARVEAFAVSNCEGWAPPPGPAGGEPEDGGAFTAVSTGSHHTCGIRTEQTVACWGEDIDGQASPPEGAFTAVSAGLLHTCGIRTDETLACWGEGNDGQASPPEGAFTAVSAGHHQTCGISAEQTVACWGAGGRASAPEGAFTAVSVGGEHTCALGPDGAAACWGNDGRGQASPPEGAFTAVSAGTFHTCGLRTDQTLACWGDDEFGQASPPEGAFTAVSAGARHTCGLRTDQTLACWGDDEFGQASPPEGPFTAVSAGGEHTCALGPDEVVACWGSDYEGQSSPKGGKEHTFAVGETEDGVDWRATVRAGERKICIGLHLVSTGGWHCADHAVETLSVLEGDAATGRVVAVWSPDAIVRAVWHLPDGEEELEVHTHPAVRGSLIASDLAGPVEEETLITLHEADQTVTDSIPVPPLH